MIPTFDIYHASAGTGKTTTLVQIIKQKLKEGIQPERIAFVTFTRAAAEVARLRTSEALGIPLSRLCNFRTIHSMCFRAIGATKESMMDYKRYKEFGEFTGMNLSHMNMNISEGIDWDEIQDRNIVNLEQLYRNNRPYYERLTEDRFDHGRLTTYIKLYYKFKETMHYRDFTDLLEEYLAEDLDEDVDVACLDEMQDSSLLQWQVVLKAFRNAKQVYVVGDAKQAIYRFSGGEPSILDKLKGTHHTLDISYRVPSTIMKLANDVAAEIDTVYNQPCKSLNEGGEIKYLVDIEEMSLHYRTNKTIFMLARGHSALKVYKEWCIEHGINYYLLDKPALSNQDWFEYENKRTSDWDEEKKEFAKKCHKNRTWPGDPKITLSTIHQVKGDEADYVVLLSDIPKLVRKEMRDAEGEDNEHRVFYVAITRAREKLFIVEPSTKSYYPYLL